MQLTRSLVSTQGKVVGPSTRCLHAPVLVSFSMALHHSCWAPALGWGNSCGRNQGIKCSPPPAPNPNSGPQCSWMICVLDSTAYRAFLAVLRRVVGASWGKELPWTCLPVTVHPHVSPKP
jgi:hypothetical protein